MDRCTDRQKIIIEVLEHWRDGPLALPVIVTHVNSKLTCKLQRSKSTYHRDLQKLAAFGLVEHCQPAGYRIAHRQLTIEIIHELQAWILENEAKNPDISEMLDQMCAERLVRRGKAHMVAV